MSDARIETYVVIEEDAYAEGRTSIRGVVSSEAKATELIEKLVQELLHEEAIEPDEVDEARERFSYNRWVLDDMLLD